MATLFPRYGKVVRIKKKRPREMSRSGKVSRSFESLHIFGAAEKIQAKLLRTAKKSQGAAEKNKEKVEVNCTGLQQSSLVLSQ